MTTPVQPTPDDPTPDFIGTEPVPADIVHIPAAFAATAYDSLPAGLQARADRALAALRASYVAPPPPTEP